MELLLQAKVNLGAVAMKGVLLILQRSMITGASSLDCIVISRSLVVVVGTFLSAEMQSVYSIMPVDRTRKYLGNKELMSVIQEFL